MWASSALFLFCAQGSPPGKGDHGPCGSVRGKCSQPVSWVGDLGRHTGTILIHKVRVVLHCEPGPSVPLIWSKAAFIPPPPPSHHPGHILGPLGRLRLSRALLYPSLWLGRTPKRDIEPISHFYSFIHSPSTYWTPLLVPILGADDTEINNRSYPHRASSLAREGDREEIKKHQRRMHSILLLSDVLFSITAEIKWLGAKCILLWRSDEQNEGACGWHPLKVGCKIFELHL